MDKAEKTTDTRTNAQSARLESGTRLPFDVTIEEETLTDGSTVYNVWAGDQVIYCRSQIAAINLKTDLTEAIIKAVI